MFALTVAGAVVTSLVPNMVGEIIDVALADENIRHLGQLAGFLIVFLMVSNLCVAVRQYLSATVTVKFGISLTEKVFGNILHTQYRFFTENQSGDILQRVTKDLKALQDIQLDTLLGFGYDAVLAVFSMIAVLNIYWPLGVTGLIIYGLYLLPTRYMGKLLKKYSNILRNQSAKLKEMVIERIRDIAGV